jgi:hypothetical protein
MMSQKQERVKAIRRVESRKGRALPGGTVIVQPGFDAFIVEVNDLLTVVAVDLGAKESQGHAGIPGQGRGN